jgi:hypothetical protein
MNNDRLDVQMKSINSALKSSLGGFLGKLRQEELTVTTTNNYEEEENYQTAVIKNDKVEEILIYFDKIFNNQKILSDLIQKRKISFTIFLFYFVLFFGTVKIHQKINKEIDHVDEQIKLIQSSIEKITIELYENDEEIMKKLLKVDNFLKSLNCYNKSKKFKQNTIFISFLCSHR